MQQFPLDQKKAQVPNAQDFEFTTFMILNMEAHFHQLTKKISKKKKKNIISILSHISNCSSQFSDFLSHSYDLAWDLANKMDDFALTIETNHTARLYSPCICE